jgi:hypothetical protein
MSRPHYEIGAVLYTMAHAEAYANGDPGPILVEDTLEGIIDTIKAAMGALVDQIASCGAERTGETDTAPALDQLEVAVLQRLARQPGGGLSDSMWTGDERCALGGLMLREPRLVDIPPIPRSRWARWFITAEGRAALEAGATHGN